MEMAPPFTLRLGRIDAQLVHAIDGLAGEGLVQFPQIDIVDLEAVAREQARHRH